MPDQLTAREVVEAALTKRHEELSGEASPRDFEGASQILRALEREGFIVRRPTAADPNVTAALAIADRLEMHGYDEAAHAIRNGNLG